MRSSFSASFLAILMVAWASRAGDPGEDLLAAAKKGDAKAVKSLLALGANPNARNSYDATPLTFAADKGHVEIAKLLLQHKADPNVKDSFYKATPLTWAMMRNHGAVAKVLIEGGATVDDGTLLFAAMGGNAELVAMIIEKVKPKEAALSRALAATPAKNDRVVELLTQAGAKPLPKVEAKPKEKDKDRVPVAAVEDRGGLVKAPLNWPSFRGPNASGIGDGQFPPIEWDVPKNKNVRWKTPIPGLGHSCPVIWDEHLYITTAVSSSGKSELRTGLYGDVDSVDDTSEHTWRVFCLDRRSGKILWEQTACKGVPKVKRHTKGSHANPTPAADESHLVVSFGSEGLYCYDHDGKLLWSKNLGVLDSGWFYDADYQWGFGSSPVLYKDLAIIQCDLGKNSFIAAYSLADGREVWKKSRDEIPSWGSPTIVESGTRAELVTNATKFVRGYDPRTGAELWKLGRNAEITVPTPIFAEGSIFVTSGYRPIQPIYAIRPGSNGDLTLKEGKLSSDAIAWSTTKGGPYMTTPIAYRGLLYTCSNDGLVDCYDAKSGKSLYKERIGGRGGYTASPVAADGRLYFAGEEGGVRVVQAGPEFELLAVNPLGEACMCTPAICDGMLILRTQHHVVGIGRRN